MRNGDSKDAIELRRRIEHYLRQTRTPPTRFGRDAVNDPRFVFDLRWGRRIGKKIAARVENWLDRQARRRR
jgi:late competence protein required for DNA uptake (superfamily II DNA/RNA helicase)